MKGCERKKSDGWESEFMAWTDERSGAILTGVISTLVVALIFIIVDDFLEDRSLAARMDVAEAGAAEGRRAAAEFRREMRQEWRKAEARAAEDRREVSRYFRQLNELLLGISKQGVENSVRLDYLEGLRTQEE